MSHRKVTDNECWLLGDAVSGGGGGSARLSMVGQPDLAAPMSAAGPVSIDFTDPDTPRSSLSAMFTVGATLPSSELGWFMDRLVVVLTSSVERRFRQWEYSSWEQTLRADGKSNTYRSVLVSALTRQLVAAKPSMSSTRTIGTTIGQAFVLNAARMVPAYGAHVDRLLTAPTNEAWIDPWVAHLSADPSLAPMRNLVVDWMMGIQYFLRTPTPITDGHIAYLGSLWALTSISQAQFGRTDFAATYGDGSARDYLSVDISDWDTPGILYGKPARRCIREEIVSETWAQIKGSLNDDGSEVLRD